MIPVKKLCIIGVGLIGGSIGKAAKERGLAERVFGLVRRKDAVDEALEAGAVDVATLDSEEAVRGADFVVLATPVGSMETVARGIRRFLRGGCIVTDTGSTKRKLVERLEEIFGSERPFVGAHPIAGSEKTGVKYARSDLFLGRPCILTVTGSTDEEAVGHVQGFWRALGAEISIMSPAEHDAIMARVSHLPHVAATALVNTIAAASRGYDDMLAFAGSGFRDTTRIAGGSPDIWVDICLSNRGELLSSLEAFADELSKMREALRDEDAELLRDILLRASELRKKID